jgi:DNA-binding NarL/FixJ family response regulator
MTAITCEHIASTARAQWRSASCQRRVRHGPAYTARGGTGGSHEGLNMRADVRERVVSGAADQQALRRLSGREREILGLISAGLSNTAIAARLSVMERTIESHIARIFAKLDLHPGPGENRRVLAVLIYLRDGAL